MRCLKLSTAELTRVTTRTSWSSPTAVGDELGGQLGQGVGLAAARHGRDAHLAAGIGQDLLLAGAGPEVGHWPASLWLLPQQALHGLQQRALLLVAPLVQLAVGQVDALAAATGQAQDQAAQGLVADADLVLVGPDLVLGSQSRRRT